MVSQAEELAALQAASEDQLRSAAIREMRAIMMRLMKGEVAMFVEVWRTNKKCAWMAQADTMKAQLEAELKANSQNSALRQLYIVFAGMIRGEMGAALQAMRIIACMMNS